MLGGYISYDTGKRLNNILLSKGEDPVVLATVSFAYGFDKDIYQLDTISRKMTAHENELFTIRRAAVMKMTTDTLLSVIIVPI